MCEQLANCYIRAGREMWVSDGTSEGTVRVGDIDPGLSGSDPAYFARLDSTTLLFAAYMAPFGRELWRTDGTRLGTKLVTDLNVGVDSSHPTYLLGIGGTALQRSRCTSWFCFTRTHRGSLCCHQIPGLVYFSANDGFFGRELWISNGLLLDDLSGALNADSFLVLPLLTAAVAALVVMPSR